MSSMGEFVYYCGNRHGGMVLYGYRGITIIDKNINTYRDQLFLVEIRNNHET